MSWRNVHDVIQDIAGLSFQSIDVGTLGDADRRGISPDSLRILSIPRSGSMAVLLFEVLPQHGEE